MGFAAPNCAWVLSDGDVDNNRGMMYKNITMSCWRFFVLANCTVAWLFNPIMRGGIIHSKICRQVQEDRIGHGWSLGTFNTGAPTL